MVTSHNSVLIVSHVMVYGAAHALRDYLLMKKYDQVIVITHPLTKDTNTSAVTFYKNGLQKKSYLRHTLHAGSLISYLETFVITFWWVWSKNIRTDIFIGVNNLNCFAGIILRSLGYVKRVVYYSIDFTPARFSNTVINSLYHALEAFCVKHADVVWNTSPRIAEGREEYMGISERKYPQHVVPIGVWLSTISQVKLSQKNRYRALFMGHILEKQGLQKIIEAIPIIAKKIPDFSLYIVGDGPYKKTVEDQVRKLHLSSQVTFAGWIQDRKKIDVLMRNYAIALAPYSTEGKNSSNFTYYADPTKLKDYLSAGLPVITTPVPYTAEEIKKNRCGIVVEYSAQDIADAVIFLMGDTKRLRSYQMRARTFAKTFEWDEIFKYAVKTIKI